MSDYHAPLREMNFVINELADLASLARLPPFADANAQTVEAILDEAAKFASQVLAPINRQGDTVGCTWHDGEVTTPPGAKEAYQQFVLGGWNGLSAPAEHGGQQLPRLVAAAVTEMGMAANLGFSLCPMLTAGAVEALLLCGSPEQRRTWLPRLVEGTWTGTMNLTEAQAGSDLGAIRTRAIPDAGSFRIFGQKIFITHGEHDLAENIVHLVLARLPDAPAGVRGLSLFLVPKFLAGEDGSLGARNDVRCVSIEHKLGIHSSPTAVMAYGDREGATGYLVGEANRGLEYMFIMMNNARFQVGLQGVGIAERAYQQALAYARERVQGKDLDDPKGPSVAIVRHPDVRRMLMTMKALTEATRAVAYVVAAATDRAHASTDAAERDALQSFVDFMVPIHKGWATEAANEVAHLAVQVHGGMGFIEETGIAQHLRDARILSIYEGTTGIQAIDLVGRKTARDGGAAARALAASIRADMAEADLARDPSLAVVTAAVLGANDAFDACVDWIVDTHAGDPKAVLAGAVPFLELCGLLCGGWQMARAANIASQRLSQGHGDAAFWKAKLSTARFYADHLLSRAAGLAHATRAGAAGTLAEEAPWP